MKLYALFCLISLNINAQTIKEYELCNDYLTKEIRAVTTGAAVSWDVTPFVPYQLSNNVMTITFNSTGTYIISADFRVGDCYKEDKIIIIIKECTETFIYFPNSSPCNSHTFCGCRSEINYNPLRCFSFSIILSISRLCNCNNKNYNN